MSAKPGFITFGLLLALGCVLTPMPDGIQQTPHGLEAQESDHKSLPVDNERHIPGDDLPSWVKGKQRKALLRAKLANSRKDATELATLAQELREELDTHDGRTLSPDSMMRLNRIEKLAKKIREELRAY